MKSCYMICCVLFLGVTADLIFFVGSSVVPGEVSTHHGGSWETWTTSRKLKEIKYNPTDMHLDDYEPIDPVPTGKASISSGAIVHGTPLMPRVLKPQPSSPPLPPPQTPSPPTPPPSSSWDD